jgi:hypothetical protein
MLTIGICEDLDEARQLWERNWPQSCLFDLWDIRACFQEPFDRPPHFLTVTQGRTCCGLMALSWIEEEGYFGHFPGEVWQGKTWLEQNKILASSPAVFQLLWDHIPAAIQIRYLNHAGSLGDYIQMPMDEIGFLFVPQHHDYSFQRYWQSFSGKSRKKIRHELNRLEAHGVTYRFDQLVDVDLLFRMNLENFGRQSYFSDARFLEAFENLTAWLHANDLLRITTVLIGGKVAAVDMGAVWNNTYTVLAGGTHADFPGVAKLINLHHLEWSCRRRFTVVDFLCGDFNWKGRFHLIPRPLFQLKKAWPQALWQDLPPDRRTAYAH